MAAGYLMQAINLYDTINIKSIRNVLGGKIVDTSPQAMQVQYGENSYLFVYRFGCVVFFNMTNEEIDRETAKIKVALGPGIAFPTTESYQVNVGDFAPKVEFDYVELKKLSVDHLNFIALTVGQSAALEFFEVSADRMVSDTNKSMQKTRAEGRRSALHERTSQDHRIHGEREAKNRELPVYFGSAGGNLEEQGAGKVFPRAPV